MDSSLHLAYDLAKFKQIENEKIAATQRLAERAERPSRWSRVRALFGRRPADRLRLPAPPSVPAPRLSETMG